MVGFFFAAEEPNSWMLPGDINEVYWGSVAFAIVLLVFLKKGLPLVKKVMRARSERIAAELASAQAAREEAAQQLASVKSDLGNADAEAERILADARERAEALRADLIVRAEAEVAESKQRARVEIEASKAQALADLRAEVSARTAVAAEAVITANLDPTTQSSLIDQFIQQVGAQA